MIKIFKLLLGFQYLITIFKTNLQQTKYNACLCRQLHFIVKDLIISDG